MLYFDGYCPECQLQGREVPMVLNQDDFWESPETGLQIAVWPPYATILRWRGSGLLKQPAQLATDSVNGMVLAEASKEEGKDIMPDTNFLVDNEQALEWYLHEVCPDQKTYKSQRFNSRDPRLDKQRRNLEVLTQKQWASIFNFYQAFCNSGITINIMRTRQFQQFHHQLVETGIIFEFQWQCWQRGWDTIRNPRSYYGRYPLVELSMYLSAIFLSEPYDEGTVEFYFNNKTLEKILKAMEEKVLPPAQDDIW